MNRADEPCSESGCVQVQRSAWMWAADVSHTYAWPTVVREYGAGVWLMRDGKDPGGGLLAFTDEEWRVITRGIVDSGLILGALSLRMLVDNGVLAFRTDAADAVVLRFTSGEWLTFVAGVRAGLFA